MLLMPSPATRTIVVGASSGIGAAIVTALAARGDPVVAVARRKDELAAVAKRASAGGAGGPVTALVHDVTDAGTIPAAFEEAVRALGGLDRIVYAAGVLPKVGIDEFDAAKDRQVLLVNTVGAVGWLDLAAVHFQKAGTGQIVGISSVAGERGRRPYPAYCASKAALTTYLEALRNRLSRKGVSVVTVKPGFVGTDMLKAADKVFWVISPEDCAARIIAGADHRRQSFYVPARWGLVACVIRNIPSFLFRRMNV
jgi:short-subunit dehydrogenase